MLVKQERKGYGGGVDFLGRGRVGVKALGRLTGLLVLGRAIQLGGEMRSEKWGGPCGRKGCFTTSLLFPSLVYSSGAQLR